MNLAVLIPAFQPGRALVDLVETIAQQPYSAIVIVNDGSAPEYEPCFEAVARVPRVHVLRHYVNVGKGAALKTGINFILCSLPDCMGVVTMDADGQHHPEDARKVAEALLAQPDQLILGVRRFGSDVPLRSRFGNQATRLTFFLTTGQRLSDTQTGLRGIPRKMLPALLRLPSTGYEFELDMLLACKRQACPLQEVPIRTIYESGNPTSHFNPLLDSLRIYFVLLRFSFLSLATAIVDNLAFVLAFFALSSILYAQIIGRLVAVLFNYPLAQRGRFPLAGKTFGHPAEVFAAGGGEWRCFLRPDQFHPYPFVRGGCLGKAGGRERPVHSQLCSTAAFRVYTANRVVRRYGLGPLLHFHTVQRTS